MRFYSHALKNIMNKKTVSKTCSKINPSLAKLLFREKVKIKEKSSGIIFEAWVIDYCSEDQKGIIIKFGKDISRRIDNKKLCQPSELNSKSFVELDLRNIHHGRFFEILI